MGLSKGSEADSAGIEQGDQLLQVANMELSSVTPFQAATLIAGPDDSSAESLVNLKVQKTDGQVMDVAVQRPPRYLPSPVSSSLQERSGGRLVSVSWMLGAVVVALLLQPAQQHCLPAFS